MSQSSKVASFPLHHTKLASWAREANQRRKDRGMLNAKAWVIRNTPVQFHKVIITSLEYEEAKKHNETHGHS